MQLFETLFKSPAVLRIMHIVADSTLRNFQTWRCRCPIAWVDVVGVVASLVEPSLLSLGTTVG
jgi:hypothetical protein